MTTMMIAHEQLEFYFNLRSKRIEIIDRDAGSQCVLLDKRATEALLHFIEQAYDIKFSSQKNLPTEGRRPRKAKIPKNKKQR